MLKGHPYAAGGTFTVADISLCVTVSQIEAFGFELLPYKNVRVWLKKCKVEMDAFGYEVKSNG
jgi:glutathione S-transferase